MTKAPGIYRTVCRLCHYGHNHNNTQRVTAPYKLTFCQWCGFSGHPCQLDVDHKDEDRTNNDPSNYQTLCANCHRLKTWCVRNGVDHPMIRQSSAWGQFWFDLSAIHGIHGCGITTPLQTHLPPQPWKKPYHGLWVSHRSGGAVYREAQGETMIDYLRDGLRQWEIDRCIRMKVALLAVACEEVEWKLERQGYRHVSRVLVPRQAEERPAAGVPNGLDLLDL